MLESLRNNKSRVKCIEQQDKSIEWYVCVYVTPPPGAGHDTRSIFTRNKAGLHSEFSF